MTEPLLQLSNVHTHIGPYHILHGVDFAVPAGELTMLLGRNGAGKTTTLRTIMGLWQASSGRIRFDGRDITASATPVRSRAPSPCQRRAIAIESVVESADFTDWLLWRAQPLMWIHDGSESEPGLPHAATSQHIAAAVAEPAFALS